MRPIHSVGGRGDSSAFNAPSLCSSGRRRPSHPTGGMPVQSDSGCTPIPPRTRRGHNDLYVARETFAASQCYGDHRYQGTRRLHWINGSNYYTRFVPGPTCRGSVSLYVPPLNYKREGTLRYIDSQTEVIQYTTQAHEQYNSQWSRVLRSGGPNYSKLLRVLVFIQKVSQQAKSLGPSSS
jgi:hypothetical protein